MWTIRSADRVQWGPLHFADTIRRVMLLMVWFGLVGLLRLVGYPEFWIRYVLYYSDSTYLETFKYNVRLCHRRVRRLARPRLLLLGGQWRPPLTDLMPIQRRGQLGSSRTTELREHWLQVFLVS